MIACLQVKKEAPQMEEALQAAEISQLPVNLEDEALKICHEVIIVDGHLDIPYRLLIHPADISQRTPEGHFDYIRAKEGGLDAPFMSIYIPAEKEMNGAYALASHLIATVEKLCAEHPDKFALAFSPADIQNNFSKGLISLPMGMENGAPIEGKLENLEALYNKGIRYITLTHSKDNHICDSSYDRKYTNGGLSPFGFKVVERMNQLGIMVDVSHVTDSTIAQVLRISKAPVIASHSSCRYFTPRFERNLSDELIKSIANKNGVVMITFGSAFITEKGNRELDKIFSQIFNGHDENDPAIKAKMDSLRNLPDLMGTVADVADHIDHAVKIAGIDHVGLGSDFDGVDHLPLGLTDVSQYPNLILELLKRGYTNSDIEKICSGNLFRVWNEVIAVADKGAVS